MTIDIARLPRRSLAAGAKLYRIHRAALGPWYFSSDGDGRFDPVGTPGRGTCYLAERPLGAWIEKFRTTMLLGEEFVGSHSLCTVTLDRELEVIDLTYRPGLAAGVTTALTSGPSYTESYALSDAAQAVADGVRWRVRHDLEQVLVGVGLFGPEHAQPPDDWPPAHSEPIRLGLIRLAEDSFGYRVVPDRHVPRTADRRARGRSAEAAEHARRALRRANVVRQARSELKRRVGAGDLTVAEVVLDAPWEAETMAIADLLMSQKGWGRVKARRFLASIPLAESEALGSMTERQRMSVATRLAEGTIDPFDD